MADRATDHWELILHFSVAGETWTNSFTIADTTSSDTPPGPTAAVVDGLINFMVKNLAPPATIDSAELRNLRIGTGPLPLDEEAPLWVRSVGTVGTRNTSYGSPADSTALDFRSVAYAKKLCTGRKGKLFIRNFLVEGDVEAVEGGHWTYTGGAGTVNPSAFHAFVTSDLGAFLAGGSDPQYKLAVLHIRITPTSSTSSSALVTDVILENPTWHRRRH